MQSTQNYLMLVLRNKTKKLYKDSYTCTHELGEAIANCYCGLAKHTADSASFEWSHRDLAYVCVCVCVSLGSHSTNTAFAILIWNYPRPILMLLSPYPMWANFGSCKENACTHSMQTFQRPPYNQLSSPWDANLLLTEAMTETCR